MNLKEVYKESAVQEVIEVFRDVCQTGFDGRTYERLQAKLSGLGLTTEKTRRAEWDKVSKSVSKAD